MSDGIKILTNNKKAFFNYFLEDFLECGIELKGTEIKSLRRHNSSLVDAYVIIKDGEAYLLNMHIPPYEEGNIFNGDPYRTRKLLLHKKEILKMDRKMREKSLTCVPTKVYLKKGMVKVEIALAKGKKNFDKREVIKKRDDEKMMAKAKKENGKNF